MRSETLSLNEVAKEFLGDIKKSFEIKHSSELDGKDWEEYFEYNLHDSVLTLGLFEKLWPDLLEFTRVMQEPIFDVSRNGMSNNVQDYIIHNLDKFNEIPEKRPTHNEIRERRSRKKYEGAFVFEPVPGLYENIVMFDFTSSYGSVIVTYNLSKSTYLTKPEKDSNNIESLGKRVYFSKKSGFFPEMLKEIIKKRKQYKEELKQKPDVIKKARSNAFKLLANASYGYQGFFGARYYCQEAAAATAAFAKRSIKDAIEKIDKAGYKVIYSDTDSICFLLQGKTKKQTLELLKKLNSQLPGIMELELEEFFKRGIWVTTRAGTVGAKKKYALISEDKKLKIRGFETVRRDWCKLSRNLQSQIIKMILEDGNEKRALEYVKEIIKKIKNREIKKQDLIIKTQLKKPISEYKTISPHVIAAKKMNEKKTLVSQGNLIEYYIAETKSKKKLIREKVKLPDEKGEYNIQYYLEHQIIPAIENIFQVFNIDIKEIIDGKKQTRLGDF
jgi:DNA polymerase I/DNA polymerase-2